MCRPSDRIGAILSAEDGVCKFLGFGIYEGDFVPPEDVAPLLHKASVENPRLLLDDGSMVWGCQCWWGDEEVVKKSLAQYDKVEKATIPKVLIDE